MPEGDTILKVAEFLRPRLAGERIVHGRIRRLADSRLDGVRIERVYARGKHLFFELEDRRLLRTHLGLHGSWHHYAVGEAWRKPARLAGVELVLGRRVYVCFNPREVELMRAGGFRERSFETRLGPDLTAADPPTVSPARRARGLLAPETILADVLLDQRVACGIGNVFKSEVLFIEGVDPSMRLDRASDRALERLYLRARDLLRRNLGGGPRVTRFVGDGAGRYWVYGRTNLPCFRCGTPVERRRSGRTLRSTYRCPVCQPGDGSTG